MPEFDLITNRSTLMEAYPDFGQKFPECDLSHYGIKAADAEFIQKGITASDLKFEEGERAVISTVNDVIKARQVVAQFFPCHHNRLFRRVTLD